MLGQVRPQVVCKVRDGISYKFDEQHSTVKARRGFDRPKPRSC